VTTIQQSASSPKFPHPFYRYRNKTIPTAGALLKDEDAVEKQISFDM
jgi:hypothetical protein